MIIYLVLGTAPGGADRIAALKTGHADYLLSFPDINNTNIDTIVETISDKANKPVERKPRHEQH